MLQRIQTIWLFLASACAFISLKTPFYSGTRSDASLPNKLFGTDNFYLMLLTIAIGVIAVVSIFLYGNRKLQIRLCVFGILLEALLMYLYYIETTTFVAGSGTYSLTSILQVLIFIFLFLAIKGISNDNKIIKDSNRLR